MNQLANLFQLIAHQESIATNLKCLDGAAAYKQLGGGQMVSLAQFEAYLSQYNLSATPAELTYAFRQMDRDNDQAISLKDFQLYINKQPNKQKELIKLMQHEIQSARMILKHLNSFKDILQVFKAFKGSMNQNQLNEFMASQYLKLPQADLQCLFNYLDRNRDGLITYSDLQDLFNHSNQIVVLKQNQEVRLVNALYQLMHINKQVDIIRDQLAQQIDFNTLECFALFDVLNQNQITRLDFELGCMDLNIKYTKPQVALFFQRYSTDNSFIMYQDFLVAIYPKIQPIISQAKMSQKTLAIFKKLIQQMLETEEQIEDVKERLCYNKEFSIELAFKFIDKLQVGSITIDEFREVFEAHNIEITNQEIESLIQMYNKHTQNKVTYSSFIQAMSPNK